jgi:hypothetical protein
VLLVLIYESGVESRSECVRVAAFRSCNMIAVALDV